MEKTSYQRRLRRRIFNRMINTIVWAIFTIIAIFLLPALDALGKIDTNELYNNYLYYLVGFLLVAGAFGILWMFSSAGRKTDIDELEETMNNKFDDLIKEMKGLRQDFKSLSDNLINEIREDRNERNNKSKQ